MEIIIIIAIAVVVLIVTLSAILHRYKRCPSDKILVIYGKTGRNKNGGASSAKCIHGGASFIWPVFQSYSFLDLTPISIECNLTNALSKQNIRVDVPCRFTVGISTEPDNMTNAAERLLGLTIENIQNIATDILFGQLRLVIATMDIEEINSDRDKFLANVSTNVEAELRKIGLKLINVNVTDIRDESGYIEALGKEAAAKAIMMPRRVLQSRTVSVRSVRQRLTGTRISALPRLSATPESPLLMPMQRRSKVRTIPRLQSPILMRSDVKRRLKLQELR